MTHPLETWAMQIELDEVPEAELDAEYSTVARLFIARLDPRDETVIANELSALLREGVIPADLRAYYLPTAGAVAA